MEQPGEKEKIKEVSDQFNRFQMMSEYMFQDSNSIGTYA